jgi:hypothetical protein
MSEQTPPVVLNPAEASVAPPIQRTEEEWRAKLTELGIDPDHIRAEGELDWLSEGYDMLAAEPDLETGLGIGQQELFNDYSEQRRSRVLDGQPSTPAEAKELRHLDHRYNDLYDDPNTPDNLNAGEQLLFGDYSQRRQERIEAGEPATHAEAIEYLHEFIDKHGAASHETTKELLRLGNENLLDAASLIDIVEIAEEHQQAERDLAMLSDDQLAMLDDGQIAWFNQYPHLRDTIADRLESGRAILAEREANALAEEASRKEAAERTDDSAPAVVPETTPAVVEANTEEGDREAANDKHWREVAEMLVADSAAEAADDDAARGSGPLSPAEFRRRLEGIIPSQPPEAVAEAADGGGPAAEPETERRSRRGRILAGLGVAALAAAGVLAWRVAGVAPEHALPLIHNVYPQFAGSGSAIKSAIGNPGAAHQAVETLQPGGTPWGSSIQGLHQEGIPHPTNAQIETEDAKMGRVYMAAHHLANYSWRAWSAIARHLPGGTKFRR